MAIKRIGSTAKTLALLLLLSLDFSKGAMAGTEPGDSAIQPSIGNFDQNNGKKDISTANTPNSSAENSFVNRPTEFEGEEMTMPLTVRAMIAKTAPLPVEHGLLQKLEKLRNNVSAILVFCSTTRTTAGESYENLIRLLHEEMVRVISDDGRAYGRYPNFLEYARIPNKVSVFVSCLEHDAANSSPETLFRLFQIEQGALRSPPNTLKWLLQAAEGGHPLAQYVSAQKILEWARRPSSSPVDLRPYMNVDAYHRFILDAAERGLRLAQMSLARFYLDRFPIAPENVAHINVKEGLRWLTVLAGQADDLDKRYEAISSIGALYFKGSVGPDPVYPTMPGRRMPEEYAPNNTMEIAADHAEALRWYQRVPDSKKNCGALSALRHIYRLGWGVPIDFEKAEHYQRLHTSRCNIS